MASQTLVIWILFKMRNGARAVGKSSNIISPSLQKGDSEKLCDLLKFWIKEKKEVTVRYKRSFREIQYILYAEIYNFDCL